MYQALTLSSFLPPLSFYSRTILRVRPGDDAHIMPLSDRMSLWYCDGPTHAIVEMSHELMLPTHAIVEMSHELMLVW